MRYRRHNHFVSTMLSGGVAIYYWEYVKYLFLAIIAIFFIRLVIKLMRRCCIVRRNVRLQNVDAMDGLDFELYIADLLTKQGYNNVSLTEEYDYGVDIVAEKDGIRWGIQTKRYSGLVKAEAVRQVVTGLRLYSCDRAMVITNSTYSNVARRLAEGNDCVLIDREGLYSLAF